MVNVRDMTIGNMYNIDGEYVILEEIIKTGNGGSGYQEPYYTLIFTNGIKDENKDWQDKYDEVNQNL